MIPKSKFRESSTQYQNVNGIKNSARSDRSIASKDSGREVKRFWSTLSKPDPGKLRSESESFTSFQRRKKDHYVQTAFNDIFEQSLKIQELEEEKAERRGVRNLSQSVFQSSRFAAGDFSSSSRLNLPVHTFINAVPHAWGREIAVLQANVKKSLRARRDAIHTGNKKESSDSDSEPSSPRHHELPVPAISIMPPHTVVEDPTAEPDWVLDIRYRLRMAEEEALNQTISLDRMKELHAQLSDFDLMNRPTHFIHLNSTQNPSQYPTTARERGREKSLFLSPSVHDPLEGEEDARSIYARLPTIISEESLNTVLERGDVLLDYLGMGSSTASSSESAMTLNETEDDGESKSSEPEKVGFDNMKERESLTKEDPNILDNETESENDLEAILEEVGGPDREEDQQDSENVGIANAGISMSQSKDSLFELECLRDLVNIAADDDLWEDITEDKEAS